MASADETRATETTDAADSYRGRLAPSPTGLLHLGHAQTFLKAEERARAARGTLILRNEDLDPQRSRAEFVAAMIEDLRWLGLEWQEGPDVGGSCAPYSQSERRNFYLAAWRRLVAEGWVYPCTCTRKDLARAAQAPHEGARADENDEPLYPGTCRPHRGAQPTPPASPRGLNWRFRVPDGERIRFQDLRQGAQAFTAGSDFGDFLVWRRDDVPSYQLAVVCDDALMHITEVVRGADLLKSTARQILLQRALGHATPRYYHCDLVTDERGLRLSKRHDALSLRALRSSGVSPAQLRAQLKL
ncbi:MAG TPA: tRNA glutamyl-Q(34) synthetase GluQRS [Pyrinomonadaceae bacterium]|nr:tRNA glutamyl-Q(34) synthetase GluQRS [Pyrinomonadaceae bacterium]